MAAYILFIVLEGSDRFSNTLTAFRERIRLLDTTNDAGFELL